MADYRVEFPDDQVWTIALKGKSGEVALRAAHQRASAARAAEGLTKLVPFRQCVVRKVTPKLRAELEGLPYLTWEQLLEHCRVIGSEYQRQQLGLTVRGMYYQLVSRGFLPSGKKEYDRVVNTLSQARMKGDFPLGLLTDSSRRLREGDATRYDLDVDDAIRQAGEWIPQLDRFFLRGARWYRQHTVPIVLFEKEALSNVLGPVCRELGVTWMATKGYPSLSTLFKLHQQMVATIDPALLGWSLEDLAWEGLQALDPTKKRPAKGDEHSEFEMVVRGHELAIEELLAVFEHGTDFHWTKEHEEDGTAVTHSRGKSKRFGYGDLTADEFHQGTARRIRILYLGDHDPDGLEIPLDLERRLRVLQVRTDQLIPFEVQRLGLNREQIEEYDPVPFWAKLSSAQHGKYVERHPWARGRAWELDALEPTVLRDLTQDAVESFFDEDIFDGVQAAVQTARDRFNERMQSDLLPSLIS